EVVREYRADSGTSRLVLRLNEPQQLLRGVRRFADAFDLVVPEGRRVHLFDAASAQLQGQADEGVLDVVLAIGERGTGDDALLVEQDSLDHPGGGRSRRIEGGPGLQ